MHNEPPMSRVGALIGSPARALMLTELFDGRALTATELAAVGGVSAATASEHLSLLLTGGLVTREKSGRHNYYRLASAEIANALEQLAVQTANIDPAAQSCRKPRIPIQDARMCYDHIAGHLGVSMADALVKKGALIALDTDYEVTPKGEALFDTLGINTGDLRRSKRVFARQCLDWSERRHHLSGAVGAALANLAFDRGWITRTTTRRVLIVTPVGQREMKTHLGITFNQVK
ncbi:ArsR/SmtB family transcription factor [Ruegeria halocynthiae]|uniref:ArsR/SmtB family transcription factor n=1 Tax=Ruegeria halocynthiae TaxID=985054 RepID=UPI0005689C54|nr:winged helix-turn-helix domain-containing protein [Ruegeria halocynthiae]